MLCVKAKFNKIGFSVSIVLYINFNKCVSGTNMKEVIKVDQRFYSIYEECYGIIKTRGF